MRLYSFIENERGVRKQQGGQKKLAFTLLHETKGGDWRCSSEEISVIFLWNEGKPQLSIILPQSWRIDEKSKVNSQAFHFLYQGE